MAAGDGHQRPADLIDGLSGCEVSNEVRIQNHFGETEMDFAKFMSRGMGSWVMIVAW